jgi:hypothetical protein
MRDALLGEVPAYLASGSGDVVEARGSPSPRLGPGTGRQVVLELSPGAGTIR